MGITSGSNGLLYTFVQPWPFSVHQTNYDDQTDPTLAFFTTWGSGGQISIEVVSTSITGNADTNTAFLEPYKTFQSSFFFFLFLLPFEREEAFTILLPRTELT